MSLFGIDDSLRKILKELKDKLTPLGLLNAFIIGLAFLILIAEPIWNLFVWLCQCLVKFLAVLFGREGPVIQPLEVGGLEPYFVFVVVAGLICLIIVGFFEKNKFWPDQKDN